MPALNILHVTPYYRDAWAYGGIPRVAAALARGQARRGHRVTVCTTDACDGTARLAVERRRRPRLARWPAHREADGVEVRVFPNASNALAYHLQFFVPLGLDAYLRGHAREFDVAHLHGFHHLPGARAARRLRRAGIPYVLAPNGTAPRIERRRLAKRLFDATLGRGVMPGAARVLAVTEAERSQLVALGVDPASIAVIPNPVDLSEFDLPLERGRFRRRVGLPDGPVVLFLGTLTPRKRVDVLIDAVARLGRPEARLVVAGNDLGTGPRLRRRVRRLGLDQVTTFTGLLTGRQRLEALADADVVVYPSRDEVFGLVPLEALLCGTPVIVADDCGAGEVIGRVGGGLVVPQGNVAALARAIEGMLDVPAPWRDGVTEAAARIRALYACDTICARLEALYADVVAPGA